MLEQVCNFVHNYFELSREVGKFSVSSGVMRLPFLLNGQRFKIIGSTLNDGIYTYYDNSILNDDGTNVAELHDETFSGTIIAMGVPKLFLDLVAEINTWQAKNADALNSPYTSESFGGYTYSKATGSGANAGGILSWQDVFKAKLNAYRKIA